ncbi:hypothetical protein ATO12_13590 [Aquimarina atlantica]|uniref:Lipoprotein n=1 Tax=Aquimarina atlantica TaxID=1317122 RepID=A0A023BV84_9FLAO|nr:hypothetical protein [Aquimarina atlantica]EZH73911.1 hypothetical protein ATO12_13590 [Aquimarina atlantica]
MKKITIVLLITIFFSCKGKKDYISDPDDIVSIQKLVNEVFEKDKEVYYFSLSSAERLRGTLSSIYFTYKFKDTYFNQTYDVQSNTFSDPVKKSRDYKKGFKIGDLDLTAIPERYMEALQILEDKKLLKEDKLYYLDSWDYRIDRKGEVYVDFTLNFYVSSNTHGRVRTTTYDSHNFTIKNNQLKLRK